MSASPDPRWSVILSEAREDLYQHPVADFDCSIGGDDPDSCASCASWDPDPWWFELIAQEWASSPVQALADVQMIKKPAWKGLALAAIADQMRRRGLEDAEPMLLEAMETAATYAAGWEMNARASSLFYLVAMIKDYAPTAARRLVEAAWPLMLKRGGCSVVGDATELPAGLTIQFDPDEVGRHVVTDLLGQPQSYHCRPAVLTLTAWMMNQDEGWARRVLDRCRANHQGCSDLSGGIIHAVLKRDFERGWSEVTATSKAGEGEHIDVEADVGEELAAEHHPVQAARILRHLVEENHADPWHRYGGEATRVEDALLGRPHVVRAQAPRRLTVISPEQIEKAIREQTEIQCLFSTTPCFDEVIFNSREQARRFLHQPKALLGEGGGMLVAVAAAAALDDPEPVLNRSATLWRRAPALLKMYGQSPAGYSIPEGWPLTRSGPADYPLEVPPSVTFASNPPTPL